jgi:membrane-associated protein
MEMIDLIIAAGYVGIVGVIFIETGLLIGFFLPGDSLLFTAGFLASTGVFNIWLLSAMCAVAAVAGDSVGYALGRRLGPALFRRRDSFWFRRDHIERSKVFFDRHGPKTIVLARFMPIVRTFAPVLAGIGRMEYSRFLSYNIFGGVLWAVGLPMLGYWLGATIPGVDQYLYPIILAIILLSIAPGVWGIMQSPRDRARIVRMLSSVRDRVFRRA